MDDPSQVALDRALLGVSEKAMTAARRWDCPTAELALAFDVFAKMRIEEVEVLNLTQSYKARIQAQVVDQIRQARAYERQDCIRDVGAVVRNALWMMGHKRIGQGIVDRIMARGARDE